MSGTSAKDAKLYLSTTDMLVGALTTAELLPTNDISIDSSANLLEDTSHGGDVARSRVVGLLDSSFSCNVFPPGGSCGSSSPEGHGCPRR